MKFKFFNRNNSKAVGCDVKAAMINAAFSSEFIYDDFLELLDSHLISPENLTPTIFALSRATGELLKALERNGYLSKTQYEAMLNVWLYDVDDNNKPFSSLISRFKEYREVFG